jgi:hypothetical protein
MISTGSAPAQLSEHLFGGSKLTTITSRLSSAFPHPQTAGPHSLRAKPKENLLSGKIVQPVVERSFGWLVHWGGLLRDRAGRLDVSTGRLAFVAILSGVQALLNPMPIRAA